MLGTLAHYAVRRSSRIEIAVAILFVMMDIRRPSFIAFVACMAAMATGCASKGTTIGTAADGDATVTLLGTSTANDQLTNYNLVFNTLTLTKEDGATVSVLAAPLHAEFIHRNGLLEPLATVSLPQGTYLGATATMGIAHFGCVGRNPSGAVVVNAFAYGATASSHVTVNLPAPIVIGPGHSALALDLLVSKSAAWITCSPTGTQPYAQPFSITPTFTLANAAISSPSMAGLEGQVAAVNAAANTFTVTADDGKSCVTTNYSPCDPHSANGPVWQLEGNTDTVLQGVSNLAELQPGMPVEMDGSLQPDGSILASRISVLDTNPVNVTGLLGPIIGTSVAWPVLEAFTLDGWGPVAEGFSEGFNFSNGTFQISRQLNNLQNLPFSAGFTSGNIVPGQRTLVTSHATSRAGGPTYVPATTVTLLPQTINGMIEAIGNEGSFTTFTVILAPYDLFPILAVQDGQKTLLTNPDTVVVYVDTKTQMRNTDPIAVGSMARFYGLVFNDNGTLRLNCSQVSDGVPE